MFSCTCAKLLSILLLPTLLHSLKTNPHEKNILIPRRSPAIGIVRQTRFIASDSEQFSQYRP